MTRRQLSLPPGAPAYPNPTVDRSLATAANFTFVYSAPTQCDDFNVSWTGGTAPFELSLVPVFGRPTTVSIPSSSVSNGRGAFQVPLQFAKGDQLLVIMSDATGFATGGVSNVLTVGDSVGKQTCNTTKPAVDFFYETNSALVQCRTYTFSGYTNAVQPITIQAVVPHGQAIALNPPSGSDSFGLDYRRCFRASTTSPMVAPSSSGGTIAGAVIGSLIGVAIIGSLVVFLLRRHRVRFLHYVDMFPCLSRRKNTTDFRDGTKLAPAVSPYPLYNTEANATTDTFPTPNSTVNLLRRTSHPGVDAYPPSPAYSISTPIPPNSQAGSGSGSRGGEGSASISESSTTLSTSRKAAMAGVPSYQAPARFILHTDAEDEHPDDNEVVELPPQYSERRAPTSIPGLLGNSANSAQLLPPRSSPTEAYPPQLPPLSMTAQSPLGDSLAWHNDEDIFADLHPTYPAPPRRS
ncbi:hypothetical protein A0H81_01012 [Grifola frondosa]|uniref:Uncharacterized protein n=1 Tax=Grifola frondosa TaxID=5627 RepID=A0A1C7MRR1_GRIFR|nr:hypothetical protein A0H81_01012 [Grifola frondosa]